MVVLIFTYYVFVYDPVDSLRDHDGGNVDLMPEERHHDANPIDSSLLRPVRAFLGEVYTSSFQFLRDVSLKRLSIE